MPSTALVELRRHVVTDWRVHQDEQARRFLIRVARTGHALLMTQYVARRIYPVVVAYAHRPGIPVDQVRLPGPIVYEYHREDDNEALAEIIADVLQALRDASPIVSGTYRDSHTLYINEAPVQASGDNPEFIAAVLARSGSGPEIMIANPVPYTRRIEIGVTKSGRPFVLQVPPHIYRRIGKVMADRYRGQAMIELADDPGVALPDSGTIKGVVGRRGISTHHQSGGRRVRRRRHGGESIMSPAIYIRPMRQSAAIRTLNSLPVLTSRPQHLQLTYQG